MKKIIISLISIQLICFSLRASNTIHVSGCIKDTDNKPVAGVVVNDGYNFTVTKENGKYQLVSDGVRSKFVSISIPAFCEISTNNNIADGFYQRLDATKTNNVCNFTLKRRPAIPRHFTYILMADPQVKNQRQLDRFISESVPDIRRTADSLNSMPVIGMTLGDLVWDAMDLDPQFKSALTKLGLTVFNCIGNHDFNKKYDALSDTTKMGEPYAEQNYNEYFGPTDYSFNMGDIHIITMKDIDYHKGRIYTEQLTPRQIEWLKRDLSYVKPGTTVFFNVHAPFFNINSDINVRNAQSIIPILKPFNVHFFDGHTHYFDNEEKDNIYEHNVGTVCGAWWAGHVATDGTPNGYLIVDVNGNKLKWEYKAVGQPNDYQFRLYGVKVFGAERDYVVANVWDWDNTYKVTWSEDGISKGNMEQFREEDQDYIMMHNGIGDAYRTHHLFRALPSIYAKRVEVKVTNRFGETYTEKVNLDK